MKALPSSVLAAQNRYVDLCRKLPKQAVAGKIRPCDAYGMIQQAEDMLKEIIKAEKVNITVTKKYLQDLVRSGSQETGV